MKVLYFLTLLFTGNAVNQFLESTLTHTSSAYVGSASAATQSYQTLHVEEVLSITSSNTYVPTVSPSRPPMFIRILRPKPSKVITPSPTSLPTFQYFNISGVQMFTKARFFDETWQRYPSQRPTSQMHLKENKISLVQKESSGMQVGFHLKFSNDGDLTTGANSSVLSSNVTNLSGAVKKPTKSPTLSPDVKRLTKPSRRPTRSPSSIRPSKKPVPNSTNRPSSRQPSTTNPSTTKTSKPSNRPNLSPTRRPTSVPSSTFSVQPSIYPTSALPSRLPSALPTTSAKPPNMPSKSPSLAVSVRPSSKPTVMPVKAFLSPKPSLKPTSLPVTSLNPSPPPTSLPLKTSSPLTVKPSPSLNPSPTPTIQPRSSSGTRTSPPSNAQSKVPAVSLAPIKKPTLRPVAPSNRPSVSPTVYPSPITIFNGPLHLYNIYIGDISGNSKSLVDYFAQHVGTSSWYYVLRSYFPGQTKASLLPPAKYINSASIFPHTRNLTIDYFWIHDLILNLTLSNQTIKADPNGIYTVIFRGSFNFSGWSNDEWCGYRTLVPYGPAANRKYLRVSVIGDPSTYLARKTNCLSYTTGTTANNNLGADSVISTYANLIVDTIVNYANVSLNLKGFSERDIPSFCTWKFGTAVNSNVAVGSKRFLLPLIYEPHVGCVLSNTTIPGSPTPLPTPYPYFYSMNQPTSVPYLLPTVSPAVAYDLSYHGGALMTTLGIGFINIYIGDFDDKTKEIIDYFSININQTAWFNTLTAYYEIDTYGSQIYFINSTTFFSSVFLSVDKGTILNEAKIEELIFEGILNGNLTLDSNSIYTIMFSGDFVAEYRGKQWLRDWCGFHGAFRLPSSDVITYSVIGNPATAAASPSLGTACMPLGSRPTANGDAGADSMIAIYAAQLASAVTNFVGAWYADEDGKECGSACDGDFGALDLRDTSGVNHNLVVGKRQYLVQSLWQPGFGCTMEMRSE